jgi:hypothetical protein
MCSHEYVKVRFVWKDRDRDGDAIYPVLTDIVADCKECKEMLKCGTFWTDHIVGDGETLKKIHDAIGPLPTYGKP